MVLPTVLQMPTTRQPEIDAVSRNVDAYLYLRKRGREVCVCVCVCAFEVGLYIYIYECSNLKIGPTCLLGVAKGGQGVCRLPRLRNDHDHILFGTKHD